MRFRWMRAATVVVATVLAVITGCRPAPEKDAPARSDRPVRPTPGARRKQEPEMLFRSGDLIIQAGWQQPDVLRVQVRPAGTDTARPAEQREPLAGSGCTAAVDARDTLWITQNGVPRWQGRISTLASFGRLQIPGLEIAWPVTPDEAVYGLGERFDALDQYGRCVEMWIEDNPGQGDTGNASYFVTPVLYSSAGYALFAGDNPEGMFDLDASGDGWHRYQRCGQTVTFYVAVGNDLHDLVQKRTDIQGPLRVPPDWAWGPWISKNSYENQAEAEAALRGMLERDWPVAAMVQEAWKGSSDQGAFNQFDPGRWPRLDEFFVFCEKSGVRNILWQVPILHPDSPHFKDAADKGYFVRKPDGSISYRQHWLAGFANIDFTNPEAVRFWQDLMRPVVRMGVGGFKTDDGEDIKPDDVFHDGRRGWQMHNAYAVLYGQAVQELLDQEQVNGMLWSRSGCLGIETIPALWAGDQYATWEQMTSLVRAGLSASLSGMPFWGHDIGGYLGSPGTELYIRWAQFGALSPYMQYHGIEAREPWTFGRAAEAAYDLLVRLRMNLKPELIRLARQAGRTGTPLMRPMIMVFPDDERFVREDTQYMLGSNLLVAPVLAPGVYARTVEFPTGVWQHVLHGYAFEGPSTVQVPVEWQDAPLFVRQGAELRLALDADAEPGQWHSGMTGRVWRAVPERVALLNPVIPITGDTMQHQAQLTFAVRGQWQGTLNGYWYYTDRPDERFPLPVQRSGNQCRALLLPDARRHLEGRNTRVVINNMKTEKPLLSFTLPWQAPVDIQLVKPVSRMLRPGVRRISLVLSNNAAQSFEGTLYARMADPSGIQFNDRKVSVPPEGHQEVSYTLTVPDTPKVGDEIFKCSLQNERGETAHRSFGLTRMPLWYAAGPFYAPPRQAYETEFAPLWFTDLHTVFEQDGTTVQWKEVPPEHWSENGFVNLNELYGYTEHAAAWLQTCLFSEKKRPVELRFGSDDTIEVWLNGERVYGHEVYRLAHPDQEVVPVMLDAGVNRLTVKIGQDRNPWQMYFRMTAPKGRALQGVRDGWALVQSGQAAPVVHIPAQAPSLNWRTSGPYALDQVARMDQRILQDVPEITWQDVPSENVDRDLLDFNALLGPQERSVVYAEAVLMSDRRRPVELRAGSDDGIAIWLNGKQVLNAPEPRAYRPGDNRVQATLKPGRNRLVYRVNQDAGAWQGQVKVYDQTRKPPCPITLLYAE